VRAALVVGVGWLCLFGCGASYASPPVDACATRSDVLGLSRIVEVDTAKGPIFGQSPFGEYDFLNEGEIVLTFDDGPSRANTPVILKALDAQCTKATFFMVGRMAAADPAMVREVAKRGHTVGAHTWSHARLQGMELDKAKDEIELGFSAVSRAMQGPIAPFFRFPYLRPTTDTLDYLKGRHVASFGIDVDSRDFKTHDGRAVKATVLAQLATRHKGILLFHDIQPSTAQSIGEILAALKERGYKVVHLVPKAPVATLAAYDARADIEIGGRRIAETKEPLAPRSVVWAQSDSGKSGTANDTTEVLPWTAPAAAKPTPTKTSAVAKRAGGTPWYMQWWP
jgi:peptidoglycan/xylan/chitin deacetylase (PgdA/CDA1 family)